MDDPYIELGGSISDQDIQLLELAFVRDFFKLLAKSSPQRPRAEHELVNGNIEFEFIKDMRFNAVAFMVKNNEYIGINYGVINTYTLYSTQLMYDYLTFHEIGNAGNTKSIVANEFLKAPETFVLYVSEIPMIEDKHRINICCILNRIAYMHLLYHEIGHIVKCHIPFIAQTTGSYKYFELPSVPLSDGDCRIRRFLELDADAGAFRLSFLYTQNMMGGCEFPELNDKNYIELWAASIMLFYRIMDFLSYKYGIESSHSTHPSAWARVVQGVSQAQICVDPEVPLDRIIAGMAEVNRWWTRNELYVGGSFAQSLDVDDELRGLLDSTEHIQEELVRLQKERNKRIMG